MAAAVATPEAPASDAATQRVRPRSITTGLLHHEALEPVAQIELDAGRQVVQPLGWGLSLPVLALLIDPWSFGSSVFVLAFTGLALGALAVSRGYCRLR